MVAMPICVVSTPVKGVTINGTIIMNQLLFHEVASILLGIAKAVTGKSAKLYVREGTQPLREWFLGQLNERLRIINTPIREQMNHINVQVGSL